MTLHSSGYLSPQVQWERHDFAGPIDPEVGQSLLAAQVYSRGTDFTSWRIKSGGREAGSSLMRKLWTGQLGEGYQGLTVWALRDSKGNLIGAVSWERCGEEAELLLSDRPYRGGRPWKPTKLARAGLVGRVSLFLAPQWRQKGLMGQLIAEEVAPAVEAQARAVHRRGAFPFLRCADAAPLLLEKHVSVPMPGHISACLAETEQLRGWCARAGLEMDGFDHWKVAWEPCLPQKPRPARKMHAG